MIEQQREQKVRFQLDLTPSQAEKFDTLMHVCDFNTRKELFNAAMTLFNWAVVEAQKGKKVASYDEDADELEKLLFPALSSAAEKAFASKQQPSNDHAGIVKRRRLDLVKSEKVVKSDKELVRT